MNLFCPPCDAVFTGATACPKCGGRLITPAEAFALPIGALPPPPDLIRPTAATRVLIGTVTGLGVYFGSRDLVAAFVAPAGTPAAEWWAGPTGVAATLVLRAIAAVAGGLLAGAGRPSGAVTGVVVGLALAGMFLAAGLNPDAPPSGLELIAFAATAGVAALAGMVGAWRWEGASDPPRVGAPSVRGSSLATFAEDQNKLVVESTPSTRWVRLAVAVIVAVAGVLYADAFREQLKLLAGGSGTFGHPATAPLIDLGLAAAAVFAAGAFAGAGTGAGAWHGGLAGLAAAAGAVALAPGRGETALLPLTTLLELMDLSPDLGSGPSLAAVGGAVAGTALFAGWLGGQLLPPLASAAQARRLPLA